jgi:hypothetical protein
MAFVKVTVTNKSGHKVGLTLDDEQDAERIAYLKKQLKADVYDDVKVEPLKAEKPLEKRTVDELRQHAADNNIDLGEATKKDEILAAIVAAQQS